MIHCRLKLRNIVELRWQVFGEQKQMSHIPAATPVTPSYVGCLIPYTKSSEGKQKNLRRTFVIFVHVFYLVKFIGKEI